MISPLRCFLSRPLCRAFPSTYHSFFSSLFFLESTILMSCRHRYGAFYCFTYKNDQNGKTFGSEMSYITPKVQLTWSRVGSKDYTGSANNGATMEIYQDSYDSLIR